MRPINKTESDPTSKKPSDPNKLLRWLGFPLSLLGLALFFVIIRNYTQDLFIPLVGLIGTFLVSIIFILHSIKPNK